VLGRVKTAFFPRSGKKAPLRGCSLREQVLTRPARDAVGARPARRGGREVAMLKIYGDALDVVRESVALMAQIDRHDPDLARQLRKARSSIPLNVAEGSHARGARRNLHYGYAKGSANECIAILESAHAAGYIRELPESVIDKLRKIIGTLYRCIGGHR
jgi:four helix bundle protein